MNKNSTVKIYCFMYSVLHLQIWLSFLYNIYIYPNFSWLKILFPAAILTFCKLVYLTFHIQDTARVYGIKLLWIGTMCNVSQPPFCNSNAYLHVASRLDNTILASPISLLKCLPFWWLSGVFLSLLESLGFVFCKMWIMFDIIIENPS